MQSQNFLFGPNNSVLRPSLETQEDWSPLDPPERLFCGVGQLQEERPSYFVLSLVCIFTDQIWSVPVDNTGLLETVTTSVIGNVPLFLLMGKWVTIWYYLSWISFVTLSDVFLRPVLLWQERWWSGNRERSMTVCGPSCLVVLSRSTTGS